MNCKQDSKHSNESNPIHAKKIS
jgi:hypothetical protein